MKFFRGIVAVVALIVVAFRGILSFLNWFENQADPEVIWTDEDELEEAF